MREIVLLTALVASGCVKPTPDPAMTQLYQACNGGNTNACATVAQINAQRPVFVPHFNTVDTSQFSRNRPVFTAAPITSGLTTCRPNYDGSVVCSQY